MSDPASVMVALIVLGSATISIRAIANAAVRYREVQHKSPASLGSSATDARLERIEQAVDAIAVEVERIAEGQRFTTKLLSERSSGVH